MPPRLRHGQVKEVLPVLSVNGQTEREYGIGMDNAAAVLRSSRREATQVAVLWVVICIWVVGYCITNAYKTDRDPVLIAGIPSWVVWGILAPWMVCLAATCWFAFRGVEDTDLGEEQAQAGED